jgi:alanine-glyoxylate transaminase/serine-glyoxylate transaminase/serine-pyruvate transaminase
MLPPGLAFNVVSEKALLVSQAAHLPRSYWDWQAVINANQNGFFPYTPPTNLLFGLQEALKMIMEEGLEKIFARHNRLAEATRRAVKAWGLEINCLSPEEYSNSVTAVRVPEGCDADNLRKIILEKFNMSLGNGLGKLQGKVFRIGHMGDFNELMLAGTLSGIEMGLAIAKIPFHKGGVQAAIDYLAGNE